MLPDDDFDDDDEAAAPPPDLTVYPTDDDPEPVLYLGDGTPLYRHKPAFGFTRPEHIQRPPRPKVRAIRRRRMR